MTTNYRSAHRRDDRESWIAELKARAEQPSMGEMIAWEPARSARCLVDGQ